MEDRLAGELAARLVQALALDDEYGVERFTGLLARVGRDPSVLP